MGEKALLTMKIKTVTRFETKMAAKYMIPETPEARSSALAQLCPTSRDRYKQPLSPSMIPAEAPSVFAKTTNGPHTRANLRADLGRTRYSPSRITTVMSERASPIIVRL